MPASPACIKHYGFPCAESHGKVTPSGNSAMRITQMPRDRSALPILATFAAIAMLSVMDGAMKGASLAIGAYSAMLWRQWIGSGLALALWRPRWPARGVLRLHLLRATVTMAMALSFFHSLTLLPLAEAIAISFFAPLIALYLAVLMLGEQVRPRAVVASLIGLAGVGVVCWPDLAHGTAAELEGVASVIVSALLYAWQLVLQRRQAQIASPREIAFFQMAVSALLLTPFAPWFGALPGAALPLIGFSALMSMLAGMILAWAYARAEAQVLVPLEYSAFGWAALVGWLAFDETLSGWTLGGVVLIVAGCLVAARRAPPEPVAA